MPSDESWPKDVSAQSRRAAGTDLAIAGATPAPVGLDERSDPELLVAALRAARERLERLEAASESSALLRAISDTSEDAIFAKDRAGRLLYANPATLKLVGKPLAEVRGKTDLELLADQAVARKVMETDRRIMEGGVAEELEELVPVPDGTPRRWLSRKVPYRGQDGAVEGLLGISRDITERSRARAILVESERQLAFLVDHAPAFMAVLRGPRHVFELANERYFELVGRRDILGKPVVEALPEVVGSPYPDFLDRVYREAVPLAGTDAVVQLGPPGATKERWVDFVYLPLRGPDGATSGVFVHGVDITERKRTELALREANAELARADERKTEFLAVLSHELRNPLAPIRNAVQLLARAPAGSEAARRAQRILQRQTDQLARLVDDLLDISRIAHGKLALQPERVEARQAVRRVCSDQQELFDQRGVELLQSETAEPVWILVDPARFGQMVGNLLHNALKFTPPGGKVQVSLRQREGQCEVAVRDTGAGIAPDDLARIFEPFSQGRQGEERAHGGMGVGLSLVRDLALRQGGTVRGASAGLGQGAEFVLAFPSVEPPVPARGRLAAPPPAASLAVLIVEDNEDAGATLAELLAFGGHRTRAVTTGRAGVEAVKAEVPDVLICDVGLPDLTGYEVIGAIRALPAAQGLFAIALTGYAQPRDRQQALQAGFDAHLAKPPSLEEIEALLAEVGRRATARLPA